MNKISYLALGLVGMSLGSIGCSGASEDVTSASDQALTSEFQITCESNQNQYTTCGAPGDRIQSARVVRQISFATCEQGRTWGFADNYIWVNGGCRADFDVTVSTGNQGGGGIRVLRATYGRNAGVNEGNANYYLTQACDGRSSCDYYISVSVLGDPRPGVAKDFEVLWDCGDKSQTQQAYVSAEANGRHVYLSCGWSPPPPPPPPPSSCGQLYSGQSLGRGQSVWSCDGRTSFSHQSDGNVVVYHDGNVVAQSGVYDSSTNVLTMQNDGNLVQYNTSGRVLWTSNTPNHSGAHLAVQDDCDVVIFDRAGNAIWHTNTSGCYEH